jgi:hypothetical protein
LFPEFWILPTVIYGVRNQATYYTTCRQLGNDTTYDTEKKNPTSHDVADTSAVSGRRVGKTRRHVFKTNSGRHLKKRHFQLRQAIDGDKGDGDGDGNKVGDGDGDEAGGRRRGRG